MVFLRRGGGDGDDDDDATLAALACRVPDESLAQP